VSAWKEPQPSAEPLHAQIDASLSVVGKALHTAADAWVELHSILTPEQRDEVSSHFR
jgi:hypothetical protein